MTAACLVINTLLFSHNFLTQDGQAPGVITTIAKNQVAAYNTVTFLQDLFVTAFKTEKRFQVGLASGKTYNTDKLIFATGIKDLLPDIPGFAGCWGITALHCPYCHGYEVRQNRTEILGNGKTGYEMASLISNWTKNLTLFSNGEHRLNSWQVAKLDQHGIRIVQEEISALEHTAGYLQNVVFKKGGKAPLDCLYTRNPLIQHSTVPELPGCELNDDGYLKINPSHQTSVNGVFACGDNTTRMRTVANAVASGTSAGMMVNKQLIEENF